MWNKMSKIQILLIGYGSQGTRIAEAVIAQPDIQLVGIGLKEPDIFAHMAFRRGFQIYAMSREDIHKFKEAKIVVQGLLSDVLSGVDVAVDATPAGIGKENKEEFYSKQNVKSIFQAGEAFEVADIKAFLSSVNYDDARKADSVRIPSPSAISLTRTLRPLDLKLGIKHVACTLIRPGSEPMRGHYGPVDTVIPDRPYSAQNILREEMQYMFPKGIIFTSVAVPSILLAVEVVVIDLEHDASEEKVIDLLSKIPRTILIRSSMGLHSTDTVFEYVRRVVRPFADIYELCIWREHVEVTGRRLKLVQAFDPHCVQTPEIIDAIRALTGKVKKAESLNRTDKALKILSPGVYPA
jgi:glyceraldehyde-3-phosphate dehydrogenase (NAD(P))